MVLHLNRQVVQKGIRRFSAFTVLRNRTWQRRRMPTVHPFTVNVRLTNTNMNRITNVRRHHRQFFVALKRTTSFSMGLVIINFRRSLHHAMAITLRTLNRMVLSNLLRHPITGTSRVTVIKVHRRPNSTFNATRFRISVNINNNTRHRHNRNGSYRFRRTRVLFDIDPSYKIDTVLSRRGSAGG